MYRAIRDSKRLISGMIKKIIEVNSRIEGL